MPRPTSKADQRRYADLGSGNVGYSRISLNNNGATAVSVAVLKTGATDDPAQAFRLSRPFGTLGSIFTWLDAGTIPTAVMTYRAIDAYTSEMLMGNTHSRIIISRDGMRLTEFQKTLSNTGEQTAAASFAECESARHPDPQAKAWRTAHPLRSAPPPRY